MSAESVNCESTCLWQQNARALPAQTWDAVVVGAGPAGGIAALHLSRLGHQVLLLDKARFPRDKVCGDALLPDAVRALERAGLAAQVRAAGRVVPRLTIFSPSQHSWHAMGEYLTIRRRQLDAIIARGAVEAGAVFAHGAVNSIQVQPDGSVDFTLEGAPGLSRARLAILATGANTQLASALGLVRDYRASGIAARCYLPCELPSEQLMCSFDQSIMPGYGWMFPLGDGTCNVGVGVYSRNGDLRRLNLRAALNAFLGAFPPAVQMDARRFVNGGLRGAQLRCGLRDVQPVGPGNILLVGETIGTTFPCTGEGIGKAMETAEMAAQLASRALGLGDFRQLKHFPILLEQRLRSLYCGYEIAQRWASRPWINDFITKRATKSRFLQDSLAGIINETVDPLQVFSWRGVCKWLIS